MVAISEHVNRFGTRDGVLTVGGVPITLLADRAGSTPFFVYDRAAITERVESLRVALPPSVQLSYAVKANPMPAVVQHLASVVDRFDVASSREMLVALDTPVTANRVSFAGPGKSSAELAQAVAAGVTVEIESASEARRLLDASERVGRRARLAVRVNPPFEVKGSGMKMGGGPQQFGVDSEEVPALLSQFASWDLDVVGLHVFAGSQNLSASTLADAQRKTVELIIALAEHAPSPVSYVNLGGGFGIPYFATEEKLDLAAVGANLHELLDSVLRPRLPEAQVVLELGRYIIGEAGVYVTRVVDTKVSRGRPYAVVDGGLHHQLAASGNFGQVIRRNYPVALVNRLNDEPVGTTHVVGCSCTPLDILGSDVAMPTPYPGDLIGVFQAGAYGLTASPTGFLSHTEAVEMVV